MHYHPGHGHSKNGRPCGKDGRPLSDKQLNNARKRRYSRQMSYGHLLSANNKKCACLL